jgi:hypothetical protein
MGRSNSLALACTIALALIATGLTSASAQRAEQRMPGSPSDLSESWTQTTTDS